MTDQDNVERFADDARRYRLDSRIATGGMGEVWRATDTTLGRLVAVKILKPEYADDATFRSRFETEARNAAALHHPNVAGIFDFGQASPLDGSASPRPYLVMELVEGQPLSALLRPGQPMDAAIVSDIVAQVADGLGAAHRAGIVHRDIKPANLLVTSDRTVKITDFGIARAGDNVALTQTGMVMGTPQYISPEQAQGMTAGPASDVYSLGVVAFECLAGRRPFVAETAVATALAHLREPVPDLPAGVPADLAGVVRRSLAKKPEERYADGAAFARALRDPASAGGVAAAASGADDSTQVLTGVGAPLPVPVPPPAVEPEPVPVAAPVRDDEDEKRGAGALPWIVGVLALLLVGLLLYLFFLTGPDDDTDPSDGASSSTTTATSSAPETTSTTDTPTETETTPDTFDLDVGAYQGRNVDDVRQELEEEFGLDVAVNELTNSDGEVEGTVDDISPSRGLEAGDSVTIDYWGPEPEPEPAPEPEPTETETTAPPSSAPTQSATSATTAP